MPINKYKSLIVGDNYDLEVSITYNNGTVVPIALIDTVYFTSKQLGLNRAFTYDEHTKKWILNIPSAKTATFTPGNYTFDVSVNFKTGDTKTAINNAVLTILSKNNSDIPDTPDPEPTPSSSDHKELLHLDYASSGHTGFQPELVSGTSIKTINGLSLLGSGNIIVSGSGAGGGFLINYTNNAFEQTAEWIYDGLDELVSTAILCINHSEYATLFDIEKENNTITAGFHRISGLSEIVYTLTATSAATTLTYASNDLQSQLNSARIVATQSGVTSSKVTNYDTHIANIDIHVTNGKKAEWDAKYDKPVTGIPKTDLSSAVQASLDLADTALQSVPNTYRTSADQDIIDAGKQSVINDLTNIRSGAALGATSLQPNDNISALVNDSNYVTASTNSLSNYTSTAVLNTQLGLKQNNLTSTQLSAVNSGIDSGKVAVYEQTVDTVDEIIDVIPSEAGSGNPLADRAWVNNQLIQRNGNYVTSNSNGDTFATYASLYGALHVYINGVQKSTSQLSVNDYCYVEADERYSNLTTRNRWSGTRWEYEYTVRTSFSNTQWSAINSGVTSSKVSTYDGYASAIAGKQATLVSGSNIKTINGQTVLGSGNISIRTYQPFLDSFVTTGTVEEFVDSVINASGVSAGMAYLGELECSDLPTTPAGQFGNMEACVTLITDSIVVIEVTTGSSGYTPYMWKYNSFLGRWTKWSDVEANKSGVSTNTLLNTLTVDAVSYKINNVPSLPADASTKTYVLKAVNGVIGWVEEA